MFKIAKKMKNMQTMQTNQDLPNIQQEFLKENNIMSTTKIRPIQNEENLKYSSQERKTMESYFSRNNDNYIQNLLQIIRDTYPKNFHTPQYRKDTLAGKQRKSYEVKEMGYYEAAKTPLKSLDNNGNISLKKVATTIIKLDNRQCKSTSTTDLINNQIKSCLKKEKPEIIEKKTFKDFKFKTEIKENKSKDFANKKFINPKNVCLDLEAQESPLNANKKRIKMMKKKPNTNRYENHILMENLRNAVMHSIQILLSTPSRYGKYIFKI